MGPTIAPWNRANANAPESAVRLQPKRASRTVTMVPRPWNTLRAISVSMNAVRQTIHQP